MTRPAGRLGETSIACYLIARGVRAKVIGKSALHSTMLSRNYKTRTCGNLSNGHHSPILGLKTTGDRGLKGFVVFHCYLYLFISFCFLDFVVLGVLSSNRILFGGK